MDTLVRLIFDLFFSMKKKRNVLKNRDLFIEVIDTVITPFYQRHEEKYSQFRLYTEHMLSSDMNSPMNSELDTASNHEMLMLFNSIKTAPKNASFGDISHDELEQLQERIEDILKKRNSKMSILKMMDFIFKKKIIIKTTVGYYIPKNPCEKRNNIIDEIESGDLDTYLSQFKYVNPKTQE